MKSFAEENCRSICISLKYRCCSSLSHRDRIPSSRSCMELCWNIVQANHWTQLPLRFASVQIWIRNKYNFLLLLCSFVENIIALLWAKFVLARKINLKSSILNYTKSILDLYLNVCGVIYFYGSVLSELEVIGSSKKAAPLSVILCKHIYIYIYRRREEE
jgi:hypothetical protein